MACIALGLGVNGNNYFEESCPKFAAKDQGRSGRFHFTYMLRKRDYRNYALDYL